MKLVLTKYSEQAIRQMTDELMTDALVDHFNGELDDAWADAQKQGLDTSLEWIKESSEKEIEQMVSLARYLTDAWSTTKCVLADSFHYAWNEYLEQLYQQEYDFDKFDEYRDRKYLGE